MKDVILKVLLGLVDKKQIIGFVAGALISITAAVLGVVPTELKAVICQSPIIQLPSK